MQEVCNIQSPITENSRKLSPGKEKIRQIRQLPALMYLNVYNLELKFCEDAPSH